MAALLRLLLYAFFLVAAEPAYAMAAPHALVVSSTLGQVPDSVRTKIFAALAMGDVEGAVAAYMVHKGLTDTPRWLQAFQAAFSLASRGMGRCQQVAKDIFAALTRFGASPEYVKISSNEGDFLSWKGKMIMSENNLHVAVRYGGRIYDAFTGAAGMAEAEYRAAIQCRGELSIIVTGIP